MPFEFLSEKLQKTLKELGFSEPTEIQKEAIKKILEGKSVIVSAPTGYGKTLSAFLPFIDKIDPTSKGIQMLYITPLRSLNRDIFKNVIEIGNKLNIEIDIRHGDTSAYERANQVRFPPHCLIITPETMQSLFLSKNMVENLKNVRFVIVDEVQSLMESKRGTQLSVGLERLRRLTSFQIVGLSATIADLEETKRYLKCTDSVQATSIKEYKIGVLYPKLGSEDEEIAKEQSVNDIVANGLKIIRDTVKESKSTLIFTNTRETAEMLGSRLNRFLSDSKLEVHHSSLSKEVRTDIENRFKEGKIDVVIATSSMELGIDIGNVDMVIQYMSPRQVIKLIQRVGRSNHSQTGVSEGKILTINVDDYLESESINFNRKNGILERIDVPRNSLDILCHQIVGCVIDGVDNRDDIYNLIRSSTVYSSLEKDDFKKAVDFLIDHYMLREYNGKLVRTKRGLIFYVSNISSIPDTKTFMVIDNQMNKKIGTLDEEFIAEHGTPKTAFVMKGETWKIVNVEGRKVNVVRSESSLGAIPAWEGELMPVHRFVAEKAAELRKEYVSKFSVLKEQDTAFIMPDSKDIVIERVQGYVIIHSTFGNKINEGLSYIISEELSEKIGESVMSKIDPYRIIIKTLLPLKEMKEMLSSIKDAEGELRNNLRKTSLYTYRFINVAKRFGVISRAADYTKPYIRNLIEILKDTIVDAEVYNEIFRDKIDLDGVKDVIGKIKRGEIKVNVNDGNASPLSYEGLEVTYGGSIVRPSEARKTLRDLVKSRLNETRLYLQCLNCGYRIGELYAADTDDLKCRKCGAKLITFYKIRYKETYDPIIKKFLKKKPLNKTEENIMEGIKQNAALYLAYGKKACIVGSAYGVGPRTASRILSMYGRDEDLMIDKVIEAEKNYIETKEYWSN